MSALRLSTPAGIVLLDLGPSRGTTNAHVGGYRCVPTPEPERRKREPVSDEVTRAQWRRHRAAYRDRQRRLNDPDFIGTPEGQAWLAELNARRDRDRRMAR